MARFIQVGNLPPSVDRLALQRLFELHGAVRIARIAKHFETGWNTDAGYIEMESDEGGVAAIAALHQQEHYGRVLSVCWSDSSKTLLANYPQMFGPMNMMDDVATGKATDQQ